MNEIQKKAQKKVIKNRFKINDFYQDNVEDDYSVVDSVFNIDDETFINNTLASMGLTLRKR